MAHELKMSQVSYSKIEKNETKLTLERLYKIVEILEVTVGDILDIQPKNQLHQINRDQRSRLCAVRDCGLLSCPPIPKFERGRMLELPLKPLLHIVFVMGWFSYFLLFLSFKVAISKIMPMSEITNYLLNTKLFSYNKRTQYFFYLF